MSSGYYDAAAVERARQDILKKELDDELAKIGERQEQIYKTEQLIEYHEYIDNSVSGAEQLGTVDQTTFSAGSDLEALDFSSILEDRGEHKFEQRFKEEIAKISERRIKTSVDVADRKRLICAINEYLRDDDYDIEQKLLAIKDRIELYLSVRSTEIETNRENRVRYCALCKWLGIPEQNIQDNMLLAEINNLQNMALKRKEKSYIQKSIKEIMEELGLAFDDASILDGMEGNVYTNDDSACDIFVSADGQGIMLETVAKSGYTRNAVERDIKKTCELQAQIIEKARERGIILNKLQQIIPSYEDVVKESDITRSENRKEKTRRRTAEKAEYISGE